MTEIKPWKLLQSQMVFDHQWCQVRQDFLRLPNGAIIDDYFVTIRPDIALVLALTPDHEIVFVRQYRHGVQQILLELPAGSFNITEESGKEAAIRELQEETGYVAKEIISLGILYDNPVKDTNKIHLFLAQNVTKTGEIDRDITEEIEIILIPLSQVREKITQGEICVAGSVAAIFIGLAFLGGEFLS